MPGLTIKEPCCVCGRTKEEGYKLQRFEGKVYCIKHLHDMIRYGKVRPFYRNILTTCCICGKIARSKWKDGKQYCQKHYMQMYHHGHLLEKTIYDKNKYVDHIKEGYTECITYDKNLNESYRILIDLDKKDIISKYKVYARKSGKKVYGMLTINGKKVFIHRYLMGLKDTKYIIEQTVDHINGNSLDNRLSNLRICTQADNAKNVRKKHIIGVGWLKYNKKWTARIMSNYKNIHLGNYNTYEEAVLARLQKEKEICGEFGPNKDLFYILNHPSPIEKLKKVLSEGV